MENIRKIATSLSKMINEQEKIALTVFAAKLSQAAEAYPEDYTIGMANTVVSQMQDHQKLFITRAEIKDLYRRLYARNTKFAELFQAELGETETAPNVKTYDRSQEQIPLDLTPKNDPVLSHALNAAFNNQVGTSAFDDTAKKMVAAACAGLDASIEAVNGNDNVVICRASFETPKGKTSVFLPIEILKKQALLPAVFVGNNGPVDFSTANLRSYIQKHAGEKLTVNAGILLQALSSLKNKDEISGVDLAVTKLASIKEEVRDFYTGQIIGQNIETERNDLVIETPRYNDPEMESFAERFNSATGLASFAFGQEKVEQVKKNVVLSLNNFGLQNSQVSVINSDQDSIILAVSANAGRTAFKVPVKMNAMLPSIILANGGIYPFSKEGVFAINQIDAKDNVAASLASPLYGLKASELVNIVRQAMMEENYAKAEDALNILAQNGDQKAYRSAFVLYSGGLTGKKKATETSQCQMIVRNAASQHPICGHLNLPLHKVYQDKNGQCAPRYRQGMDETYEGAYFQNSKIFV